MQNSPRRPYYNRSQNMPQSHRDDSGSMTNKRFWKLVNNLRGRQEDAKKDDDSRKPVQSSK